MNDADVERLASLLAEIRDDQRLQLERQAEALALQRAQAALLKQQFDRDGGFLDRSEAYRTKSAAGARRVLWFVVVIGAAAFALKMWEEMRERDAPMVIDTRRSPR